MRRRFLVVFDGFGMTGRVKFRSERRAARFAQEMKDAGYGVAFLRLNRGPVVHMLPVDGGDKSPQVFHNLSTVIRRLRGPRD